MFKPKILIVDDRRENIAALESLVGSDDTEILSATSGVDALALLIDNEFALALVDVQMPGMDGFELARLMRSAARSKTVPIIFVTASQGDQRQVFAGYEQGAVDYLLKPIDPHIVRSKVQIFVELARKNQLLKEQSKALQEKLTEVDALRESAEAANKAKSRFLANMSHEIRTPLGAVLGYAELMRHDQSETERRSCVEAITRNGQLLLQLLDDILDLAKIEAAKLQVELTNLKLRELLLDLRSIHEHRAAEKGLALAFIPIGNLPETIHSDPLRLKQALSNLIGNAIKFTDKGKVEVRIRCDGPLDHARLKFEISDTGRGLSAAEAGRLFRPFVQADSSTSRQFGGTGLGLAIARELARILGGDVILIDSARGLGSTFGLSISPGLVSSSSLVDGRMLLGEIGLGKGGGKVVEFPRLDGLRILVVDDAHDNRELITRILKLAGATTEMASDGREAVTKAMDNGFNVILMDIQMPGTNGYEATRELRDRGYSKPIIALTAHAMREELERCVAAGCNKTISKPVSRLELLQSILEYAHFSGAHASHA